MTTPTVSTSANDLVTGALRKIGALAAGETPNANDSTDALQVMNDMLESWSADKLFVYAGVENILTWTPGQYQYTIGNPTQGTFSGFTTAGSPIITGITTTSLNITFGVNGSQVVVGGTLTDTQSAIPSGTTIASFTAGTVTAITFTAPPTGTSGNLSGWAGGSVTGLITFSDGEQRSATISAGGAVAWTVALTGTPTASGNSVNTTILTMSANATQTLTSAENITYTAPGNFAISRPLRIPRAFTRITSSGTTGLDYEIDVDYTGDKYNAIGLKGIPGPWPILLWYNPSFPYGNIYCYPSPQLGGALHLWTDLLLQDFTNPAQAIQLPQGYALAIKLSLALLLAPEYGKAGGAKLTLLQQQQREAVERIKKLNAVPAVQAFFDRDIVRTRRTDAGWIFHGGFT